MIIHDCIHPCTEPAITGECRPECIERYEKAKGIRRPTPAADVAPVRHTTLRYSFGPPHHVPSGCKTTCMMCGYTMSRLDGEIINYCQFCGAKVKKAERTDDLQV